MHTARHHYNGAGVSTQQWQLEHQTFQNGQERSVAGSQPAVLHCCYRDDDQNQLPIREEQEGRSLLPTEYDCRHINGLWQRSREVRLLLEDLLIKPTLIFSSNFFTEI